MFRTIWTELREAFDLFDRNRDGRITAPELETVMRSLRLEPTDDELTNMIKQADIDGNIWSTLVSPSVCLCLSLCFCLSDCVSFSVTFCVSSSLPLQSLFPSPSSPVLVYFLFDLVLPSDLRISFSPLLFQLSHSFLISFSLCMCL